MEEEDEFGDLYTDVAGVSLKDDDASSSSPPYSKREEEEHEEGDVGPSDEFELFYGQKMITSHNKDYYSDGRHVQTDKEGSPRENNENQKDLADDADAQLAQMDANGNGNGHNWGNTNSDSDSDSDDLDILVNDDQHEHHQHHHRAEQQQEISGNAGGGGGGDDEDEDDDLVIVTGDEQQPITIADTEWGDEGLQLTLEGEISLSAPPPPPPSRDDRGTGISALNSHYSQFKYVRRGAATVSGTVPNSSGVLQNQSKPSVFNGGARGPGRSDWSCSGGRGHMQRSFHSGVGMPSWSGGSMSRMQNGFEFTLPPNKTIFDINVDKFEEKRWQHPGVDVSDFFNFDLDEDSWKRYCRQLEQHRLESTMQSKICVYESGRSKKDYDPDLPPELAAATGLLEALGENIQHSQDTGSLTGTVLARGQPQFPTGRAIQVEGGIGERLPSVDVRRPRLRDSDAVIQIVLHDATEDDSVAPINAPETVDNRSPETIDNTSQREEPEKASHESEGDRKEFDAGYSLQELQAAGKRERGTPHVRTHNDGRIGPQNVHDGDGILPLPPGPPVLYEASTAEPGMYPTEPLGRPPAFRGPQLLAPYKGHLHVEDEHINGIILNRGRLTLVDRYQEESAFKDVIRKRRPVICSMREQEDRNKMHFHMKSESCSRHTSELGFQVSKEDDNGFVYYSKRQKLNSQKELPKSAADDSRIFNMSKGDNCISESGDSRGSSKYRVDEQEVSIDRQQQKLHSLVEKKGPHIEQGTHPSNGYCWNGRGDTDKDIISLNVRDVLYCHRGRDEVYLYRDPERMHYRKAKEECIDKHGERNGHIKSWQSRDGGVQIQREKLEDVRRRDRLKNVDGLNHRIRGQDSGRHKREDHLHPRERKDADDRKNQYDKEDCGKSRGIERHIVERQENEDDSYLRKKKEEDFRERNKVDNNARIRDQVDRGDINRDELDRDELQFRRKEQESRRMETFDDSCTRKPNDDAIRRDREDEHWRKSGYEEMYCRRSTEERCLLSERSKNREDRLWHANDKDENNAKEEARVMDFDKYKVYDKRRHQEHGRVRDLIDEDGSSKQHEQDEIFSWEDRLAYEQRSSRHDHIYLRHEMSCTVHGMEEGRLYRGKHILYTVSKEFHNNDQHGYSSGLADHKLRNDLTISKGRRKSEDYPSVHLDEKVKWGVQFTVVDRKSVV